MIIRMKIILHDDKYWPLQRDPTVKIENKIAPSNNHATEGHLDYKLCDFLTLATQPLHTTYGLPKMAYAAIVSTINSPSYKL